MSECSIVSYEELRTERREKHDARILERFEAIRAGRVQAPETVRDLLYVAFECAEAAESVGTLAASWGSYLYGLAEIKEHGGADMMDLGLEAAETLVPAAAALEALANRAREEALEASRPYFDR